MQPPFLALLAGLGGLGHAVLGAGEPHVAAPAAASPGDDGLRPLPHEVGQQPLLVEDHRAVRDADHEVLPLRRRRGGRGRRACRARPGGAGGPRTTPGRAGCGSPGTRRRRPGRRRHPPALPSACRARSHRGGAVAAATGAHLHVDLVHERHAEQPRWSTAVVDWAARREDWHVVEPVDRLDGASRRSGTEGRRGARDPHPGGTTDSSSSNARPEPTSGSTTPRSAARSGSRGSPVLLVDWRRGRGGSEDGLLLLAAAPAGAGAPVGDDRAARTARVRSRARRRRSGRWRG